MKILVTSFILVSLLGAKVVITPTIGKQVSTPKKSFKDDEPLVGVGLQAYINQNFAVDMRLEASDSNKMADGGKTDLERVSANMLYDFTPNYAVSPYVFAGAGYEKLHRSYKDIKSQPFTQLGAGLKFNVSEKLEFITEAKYIKKSHTDDSEVVATCGFGVKIGSDECEVSCDSLVQATNSAKSQRVVRKHKVAIEPIKRDLKERVVFSDEVEASKHLIKRKIHKTAHHDSVKGNFIQVAAYSQKSNLIKNIKRLKSHGFKIKTLRRGGATVVLVGPYSKSTIMTVYRSVKKLHSDAFFKKI